MNDFYFQTHNEKDIWYIMYNKVEHGFELWHIDEKFDIPDVGSYQSSQEQHESWRFQFWSAGRHVHVGETGKEYKENLHQH